MMESREYPLNVLNQIHSLFSSLRNIAKKNEAIISIDRDENGEMLFIDNYLGSDFMYRVYINDSLKENKNRFLNQYKPASSSNNNMSSILPVDVQNSISSFKSWIARIDAFNKVSIHPDNDIYKKYYNEMYTNKFFTELKDDNIPFDNQTQIVLSNFLSVTVNVLEEEIDANNVNDVILLKEAKSLRDNITKLTKNQVRNKFSAIFAKIKLKEKGLYILKKIADVLISKGIEHYTIKGMNWFSENIQLLLP